MDNQLTRLALFSIAGMSVTLLVKKLYDVRYGRYGQEKVVDTSTEITADENTPAIKERAVNINRVLQKVSSFVHVVSRSTEPSRIDVHPSTLVDPEELILAQSFTHWLQTIERERIKERGRGQREKRSVFPRSDDHLNYMIILNNDCGLSPSEIEAYIRTLNHHAQRRMRKHDEGTFNEWINTGKTVSAFKVPNEDCLANIQVRAKAQSLSRCMLTNGDSLVVLGLGPARVREFHRVLEKSESPVKTE